MTTRRQWPSLGLQLPAEVNPSTLLPDTTAPDIQRSTRSHATTPRATATTTTSEGQRSTPPRRCLTSQRSTSNQATRSPKQRRTGLSCTRRFYSQLIYLVPPLLFRGDRACDHPVRPATCDNASRPASRPTVLTKVLRLNS